MAVAEQGRRLHWLSVPRRSGELVRLGDGTEYETFGIYGQAGLMHTAKGSGRWFVYLHDPRDPNFVRAYGGKSGMKDMATVRRQLVHIVDRYLGVKIQLTVSDLQILEEHKEDYVIRGEQQMVGGWIETLQTLNRDLPRADSIAEVGRIRREVLGLAEGPLRHSTNRFKREAKEAILNQTDNLLLRVIMTAQVPLLARSQEIVAKTAGVVDRIFELDEVRRRWNQIAFSSKDDLVFLARAMDENADPQSRQNQMDIFLNPQTGTVARLGQLTGEPYFSRGQRLIDSLTRVSGLWEEGRLAQIAGLANEQLQSANLWTEELRSQSGFIPFGQAQMD